VTKFSGVKCRVSDLFSEQEAHKVLQGGVES